MKPIIIGWKMNKPRRQRISILKFRPSPRQQIERAIQRLKWDQEIAELKAELSHTMDSGEQRKFTH